MQMISNDMDINPIISVIAGLSDLLMKDATNIDPGRIINISSIAGLSPIAEDKLSAAGSGTYSYAVSKAAVNHLTTIMAAKFAKDHVMYALLIIQSFVAHIFLLGSMRYYLGQRISPQFQHTCAKERLFQNIPYKYDSVRNQNSRCRQARCTYTKRTSRYTRRYRRDRSLLMFKSI